MKKEKVMYSQLEEETYRHVVYMAQISGELDVLGGNVTITSGVLKGNQYESAGAFIHPKEGAPLTLTKNVPNDLAKLVLKETDGDKVGAIELRMSKTDLEAESEKPYKAKGKFKLAAKVEILYKQP
jgi:hypothetical protein